MRKGFIKKLSVCIISAATVLSAASCGVTRGSLNDLSSALSDFSSMIGSGASSVISGVSNDVRKEEPAPVSVRIKNNYVYVSAGSNNDSDFVEGHYPALSPVEFDFNESGASLWKPAKAYAALNSALEERNREILNLFNTRLSDLKARITQSGMKNLKDGLDNIIPFSIKDDAYILRADSRLFSVCDVTTAVLDQDMPYLFIDTATFDSATGKELTPGDFVSDTDELAEAVVEKLYDYYPEADDHLVFDKEELYKMLGMRLKEAFPFTVSNIGLTVYFGLGEISDNFYPTVSVCVPFEEYEGLFKEEVVSGSSDYFSMPVPGGTFYEEDGEVRMMECEAYQDTSIYRTVINIYIGDDMEMFRTDPVYSNNENSSYGADFFLLHKDGRNYVFADHYFDNDYRIADTYAVEGDRVTKVEYPDGHIPQSFRNVFPGKTDGFVMALHSDIMRTECVVNSYSIDGIGRLVPGKKLYYYNATESDDVGTEADPSYVSEYTHSYVTTKQDVPVKKVNSINDPIEKGIEIIIPAGHKLQLIATDLKTYAACSIMDDNTLVLVPVNPEPGMEGSTPQYTGNIPLTEAFEGVFWAG